MKISDLLDRPIAYHRVFVTLTGSVKAAILLSQAVYWQKRARQSDGWWYKTAEEWNEETGLTRHELDTARRDCEEFLKTDLRDVPARMYWRVDEDALFDALFRESGKSSLPESDKLDLRKPSNINRYTEITTETTADAATATANIFTLYEQNIGPLTAIISEELKDIEATYPPDWIEWAVREAVGNNVRNLKYVKACLKGAKERGSPYIGRDMAKGGEQAAPQEVEIARAPEEKPGEYVPNPNPRRRK